MFGEMFRICLACFFGMLRDFWIAFGKFLEALNNLHETYRKHIYKHVVTHEKNKVLLRGVVEPLM